jgi:hypothetical protein
MIWFFTANARKHSFTFAMCLAVIGGMPSTTAVVLAQSKIASRPLLSSPPEARSPIVLTAVNDSQTARRPFHSMVDKMPRSFEQSLEKIFG